MHRTATYALLITQNRRVTGNTHATETHASTGQMQCQEYANLPSQACNSSCSLMRRLGECHSCLKLLMPAETLQGASAPSPCVPGVRPWVRAGRAPRSGAAPTQTRCTTCPSAPRSESPGSPGSCHAVGSALAEAVRVSTTLHWATPQLLQ